MSPAPDASSDQSHHDAVIEKAWGGHTHTLTHARGGGGPMVAFATFASNELRRTRTRAQTTLVYSQERAGEEEGRRAVH